MRKLGQTLGNYETSETWPEKSGHVSESSPKKFLFDPEKVARPPKVSPEIVKI